jgi:hypothetical protein
MPPHLDSPPHPGIATAVAATIVNGPCSPD